MTFCELLSSSNDSDWKDEWDMDHVLKELLINEYENNQHKRQNLI